MNGETWEPLRVSDEEFRLFQRFIHDQAGIFLSPAKRALLAARLTRRVRTVGLTTFSAYYRHMLAAGNEEQKIVLDAICTNETRFFREAAQFDFLEREITPGWLRRERPLRSIRIWSAACSTGEEPFSIAMALHEPLMRAGCSLEIIATDLSTRVLARAASAEWPVAQADQIPDRHLRRYMLKGRNSRDGIMRATPELRALVHFQRLNLNDAAWAMSGGFHAIFCRNVLIYFDAVGKRRVVDRLVRHLAPGGWLFLGAAESGNGWRDDLVSVRPSIYRYEPRA